MILLFNQTIFPFLIVKVTSNNKENDLNEISIDTNPYAIRLMFPSLAYFQIIKVDGKAVTTSEGAAKIMDISMAGAKINSKLNIPEIKL